MSVQEACERTEQALVEVQQAPVGPVEEQSESVNWQAQSQPSSVPFQPGKQAFSAEVLHQQKSQLDGQLQLEPQSSLSAN
jgi:hypothetical protein